MKKLKVETPLGQLTGARVEHDPVANVVTTPIIGGQWVKATGSKFPLDFVICEHSDDPNVPIGGEAEAATRRRRRIA